MPLQPYRYRGPSTPPSAPIYQEAGPGSGHSRNTSGSSYRSASPDSQWVPIDTRATTPARSPCRTYGAPNILPKIRTQDQQLQPGPTVKAHRRATSLNPPTVSSSSRPGVHRSTTSPPECVTLISPASATSTLSPWAETSTLTSPLDFAGSYGNASNLSKPISSLAASRPSGHARVSSTSSILADSTARHLGYSTYRSYPQYVTRPETRPATYIQSFQPGTSTFIPPSTFEAPQPTISLENNDDFQFLNEDEPSTNISSYLTSPNPEVGLVPKDISSYAGGADKQHHFWWDIRNVRSWDDFCLSTIHETPDFDKLLQYDFPSRSFPHPPVSSYNMQPRSEAELLNMYSQFYCPKVNAALKRFCPNSYVALRAEPYKKLGPHFVSNRQNDAERTVCGNGRGRVVGLVKTYWNWNSGMWKGGPLDKVSYLNGLSHLQDCMREHNCRYGFIITEIELVCVRMGTEDVPYFGLLELSTPIRVKTHSTPSAPSNELTVCLALWYLHMLSKDQPLPGQLSWKIHTGAPADRTRAKVYPGEKDKWIPKMNEGEKRKAKRNRGWALPEDKFCRKMEGKRGIHGNAGAAGRR